MPRTSRTCEMRLIPPAAVFHGGQPIVEKLVELPAQCGAQMVPIKAPIIPPKRISRNTHLKFQPLVGFRFAKIAPPTTPPNNEMKIRMLIASDNFHSSALTIR